MRRLTSRPVLALALAAVAAGALLLPKLLRAEDPPPTPLVEPPLSERYKDVKGVIVAVVDTGVDREHPALKGKVLEGLNLTGGDDTRDDTGHGTAMAGLICAESDDAEVRGVCAGLDVKILPIKVTAGASLETPTTFVAAGIRKAVEAGARVVCVAMGSAFTSEALEEAMKLAEEKGVIVVAAAGISKGDYAHDLYPAAHPWAVSCAVSHKSWYDDGDESIPGEMLAPLANRSGKTEVMGPGMAKVIVAGGNGTATLEGSSIPCGRTAGLAAMVASELPASRGERLRRILTSCGAASSAPLESMVTSVRLPKVESAKACIKAQASRTPDLVLEWIQFEGTPGKAGQQRYRAWIRNVGTAAGKGSLEVGIREWKWSGSSTFEEIPAGEVREVVVPCGPSKMVLTVFTAHVTSESDPNDANNSMVGVMPEPESPFYPVVRRFSVSGFTGTRAVVTAKLVNADRVPRKFTWTVGVGPNNEDISKELEPGEIQDFRREIEVPAQSKGKEFLQFGGVVSENGEVFSSDTPFIALQPVATRAQYADVQAVKEVILDAPAQVDDATQTIPFLFFCPEIRTLATEKLSRIIVANRQFRAACGLWIEQVALEPMDRGEAELLIPSTVGRPCLRQGKKPLIFCKWDIRLHSGEPSIRLADPATTLENATGEFLRPEMGSSGDFPNSPAGWKTEDGWHMVAVVPRSALGPAVNTGGSSSSGAHFVRGFVRYRALPNHPAALSPDELLTTSPRSQLSYEVVLRIARTRLPRLHESGHYYDPHVHTGSEFSRAKAEPRLAFGGPPWMVLRSAHAMGFISDKDLMLARFEAHPGTRERAVEGKVPATSEAVISTDHNCFLTDEDLIPIIGALGFTTAYKKVPMRPSAPPFNLDEDLPELQILRRFFGRGANQELSVAADPQRLFGGPHSLVYGLDALPGPWHGGRDEKYAGLLKVMKAVAKVLPYVNFLKKVAPSRRVLPNPGLEEWVHNLLAVFSIAANPDHGPDVLRDAQRKLIHEVCEETGLAEDQVGPCLKALASLSPGEIVELVKMLSEVIEELGVDPNPWNVEAIEGRAASEGGAFVAAHPFAGGELHWDEPALLRAANIRDGEVVQAIFRGQFPFKGVQVWNEPRFRVRKPSSVEDLRALNPWAVWTGEKGDTVTGTADNVRWHEEWMQGFRFYVERMAGPGLSVAWTNAPPADPEREARHYVTRKLYHYAGSDAHGAFNFSTGVSASLLTDKDVAHIGAIVGHGHGSEITTSHFGAARVYCAEPKLDELLHGRCVCTDGPLAWFSLDSDLRFDARNLVWHESWRAPGFGTDQDGRIGGDGTFDGARTMLVRRGCPNVVVQMRTAGGEGLGGDVRTVEGYVFREGMRRFEMAASADGVEEPVAAFSLPPAGSRGPSFAELPSLNPAQPGFVMLGAFSANSAAHRFSTTERRCITNPVWFTSVEILAGMTPVNKDGFAVVPPYRAVVTFHCDHSMKDLPYKVLLKQFTRLGDSTARTIELVPVPEPFDPADSPGVDEVGSAVRSGAASFWRDSKRDVRGVPRLVQDSRLIATNLDPIVLSEPWFPIEGVVTFAAILVTPQDVHGNVLNSVAAKVEVGLPPGSKPAPDPGGTGDGRTETSRATRPDEATICAVRTGDTLTLPRGGAVAGRKIPPGPWTVPDSIPDAGLTLVVACADGTRTLLLTREPSPATPVLTRSTGGFTGRVPSNGDGKPSVLVKNHADKTAVVGDPLLVTPDTCIFEAPGLAPGACTVSVTRDGRTRTHDVEAVAPKLAWDLPDADVGDVRSLSLLLDGTGDPAAWTVTGTFTLQGGEVVFTSPAVQRLPDGRFAVSNLPGEAGVLVKMKAVAQGKMTATSQFVAEKRLGK